MYQCKVCGNKKFFYEHNHIKTYVRLDEETGEPISTHDEFLECAEVVCEICEATSEDKDILDREGNILDPQNY